MGPKETFLLTHRHPSTNYYSLTFNIKNVCEA